MLTYTEYFEMVQKGLDLYAEQVKEAQEYTKQEYSRAILAEQNSKTTQDKPATQSEKKTESKKVTK